MEARSERAPHRANGETVGQLIPAEHLSSEEAHFPCSAAIPGVARRRPVTTLPGRSENGLPNEQSSVDSSSVSVGRRQSQKPANPSEPKKPGALLHVFSWLKKSVNAVPFAAGGEALQL